MKPNLCPQAENFIKPVVDLVNTVPEVVSLEVTTRCQLDCVYCIRDKNNPLDLRLEQAEEIRKKLEGVKQIYICGIGESFTYPHLYELIGILKDFKISIITNGAAPIDYEKLNRYQNVELLVFSIDATTEEKMKEIARGYNFKLLTQNLVQGWKYPQIAKIINTTLNTYNVNQIVDLVEFAARYKLLAINFELPIGDEEFVEEHKERINQQIKEATKVAIQSGVVMNKFYRLTCNTRGSIIPNIRINGDLFPCCNGMNKGTKIGNIYQEDWATIWKRSAVPLLATGEYCHECNLLKNLMTVLR